MSQKSLVIYNTLMKHNIPTTTWTFYGPDLLKVLPQRCKKKNKRVSKLLFLRIDTKDWWEKSETFIHNEKRKKMKKRKKDEKIKKWKQKLNQNLRRVSQKKKRKKKLGVNSVLFIIKEDERNR